MQYNHNIVPCVAGHGLVVHYNCVSISYHLRHISNFITITRPIIVILRSLNSAMGVPRRQAQRRSGLTTLPSVGAIH